MFFAVVFSVINGCGWYYIREFFEIFVRFARLLKGHLLAKMPIIEALILTESR